MEVGTYGQFPVPLVLKREDTLDWLPLNPGELKIQQVLRNIVSSSVFDDDTIVSRGYRRGTIVNVGAHECFFCLFGALTGHRLFAVEPLPACVAGVKETFALYPQKLCDRVTLYNNYVSHIATEFDTPVETCAGNYGANLNMTSSRSEPVATVALDELPFANEDISILAIDTEGAELDVLASAMGIFRKKFVNHLFFEYTPMWYRERSAFDVHGAIELLDEIIIRQNYRCYILADMQDRISDTQQVDLKEVFLRDWNTTTTEGQTDIYCTRCARWLRVANTNPLLDPVKVTELCYEFSSTVQYGVQ